MLKQIMNAEAEPITRKPSQASVIFTHCSPPSSLVDQREAGYCQYLQSKCRREQFPWICVLIKTRLGSPVDTRPSTKKLHHIVWLICFLVYLFFFYNNKKNYTWHLTPETWQVTCDTEGLVNIVSTFQDSSFYGLGVKVFWRFETTMTDSLS